MHPLAVDLVLNTGLFSGILRNSTTLLLQQYDKAAQAKQSSHPYKQEESYN
jgi:hypothetical protein